MFYITDSAGYSPASGAPDISDGETKPAPAGVTTLLPSVVIDTGLLNSQFTSLSDVGSPYNGMMTFQRRKDPWLIVLLQTQALLGGGIEGSIYAKWGHVIVSGQGTYRCRLVSGTMRFLTVLDCKMAPTSLLPAATDVFLTE